LRGSERERVRDVGIFARERQGYREIQRERARARERQRQTEINRNRQRSTKIHKQTEIERGDAVQDGRPVALRHHLCIAGG
jgi:hypothetical protein